MTDTGLGKYKFVVISTKNGQVQVSSGKEDIGLLVYGCPAQKIIKYSVAAGVELDIESQGNGPSPMSSPHAGVAAAANRRARREV